MFCCDSLQDLVANAGERGLAILLHNPDRGLRFILQSRGIAHRDEPALQGTAATPMPVTVNVATSILIRYCPSCGRPLDQLAHKHAAALTALAFDHAKYLSDE